MEDHALSMRANIGVLRLIEVRDSVGETIATKSKVANFPMQEKSK